MPNSYTFTPDEAKSLILEELRKGSSIADAMAMVGKSMKSYEGYRQRDPEFKRNVDSIRRVKSTNNVTEVPDFETFSEKYFGMKLFRHQLQWVDLLENREPRDLHESQIYEPRNPNRVIINTPPFHAKSMTISINYVAYRIVKNPNIRIIIVSKTAPMAHKFLSAVKDRLDQKNRQFEELKTDFAPPDGYNSPQAVWRRSFIYINPNLRSRGEKDPTVEALGIGQQIYGARADLIVMDDCIDRTNAHEFEDHIDWIQTEVGSRLEQGGKLLIVGTRLMAQDLYSELRKPVWYASGRSPWTYLSQPAVQEMADEPENWKTLWPRTSVRPMEDEEGNVPDAGPDGMYRMWDGPALNTIRNDMNAENWARVYMQAQISESTTFNMVDIEGCTNGLRFAGPMVAGQRGHRPEGMAGMYVIGGIDPAASNYTAAVVLGVCRQTGRRYVLDVFNKHGCLPSEMNALMKAWTQRYGVSEWRIETNAYQKSIVQDEDILNWMRQRGIKMSSHVTNKNKWDAQFGVATMAMLFKGHEHGSNMIELPARKSSAAVSALTEQLIAWYPTPSETKAPIQDTVMALWFCEIRARELADEFDNSSHFTAGYLSDRDRDLQFSIDLDWLAAQQQNQGYKARGLFSAM